MFAFFRNLKAREINDNSSKANNEDNAELKMAHQSIKCAVMCVQEQVCCDGTASTEPIYCLEAKSVDLVFWSFGAQV